MGSADATCDDCGSDNRETSGSGYVKGGYAISEHLLLGVEFNLWTKTYDVPGLDDASSTVNVYNVSGTPSRSTLPSLDANGALIRPREG